ncbi:MAG: PilZ domain-containing protein [Bdellovibrionales bacterium]|nr:PilZ domain-containing protein [Bdellovibrionales bacterium]
MESQDSLEPAPRLPLTMAVEFRRNYARRSDRGRLRNISLTGAFLQTEAFYIGEKDKLNLTFIVSGRKRNITATVVWKNTFGCGLKFHPSNNRDLQIVDDLMYFVESKRETRKGVLEDIFKRVS